MQEPPQLKLDTLVYMGAAMTLGSIAALAALLGSKDVTLSARSVAAYLITGGVCSLGIVLLLVEQYGFSYFLVGVAFLSGYKAVEVLTLLGAVAAKFLSSFLEKK